MKDIQNQQAEVPIPIKRVGVRHLTVPLTVSDKAKGSQHTIATVELGVDLPAHFKGTHMSRFLEAMNDWSEDISYKSMQVFLQNMRERLNACSAQAVFSFPFFIQKKAPVSGTTSLQGYECKLTGNITSTNALHFLLEVCVPVMTVCPCSKAISDEGAHSQRAEVRIAVVLRGFSWLEEFIEMAERSASSPTYPLIKREDEKFVTENAFANPVFVEDVVRNVASQLQKHPKVQWYKVTVESFESIHAHNAFAVIESQPLRSGS